MRAAAPRIAAATAAGSVTSGGMKIAMMLSTDGSAATISSARRYCSGVAEAIMSTGLVTLAAGGRNFAQRRCVASASTGTSRPFASHASAARIAGPPALVTIATRRRRGTGWLREHARHVEQFLERARPDDARLAQHRIDEHVARRARPGVRRGGAGAGVRIAPPSPRRSAWCARRGARSPRTCADCRSSRGRAGSRRSADRPPRYWSRSLPETSALLPIEAKLEMPMLSRVT